MKQGQTEYLLRSFEEYWFWMDQQLPDEQFSIFNEEQILNISNTTF